MRVLTKMLAGGAAALFAAAPAAAQYYPGNPGYGYPVQPGYGYPGGGYGDYGGYGYDSQALISQCTAAVQQRLNGGYGGYGYSNSYGGYGGGRVLGVSRVEPRQGGGVTVRGVAASGRYGGYGYGYGYASQQRPDLVWKCRTDFRGFVVDVDVERAQRNYGYDNYTPYNNGYDYDYSQYGYRRY